MADPRLAPTATLLPPLAAGSILAVFGKPKWGFLMEWTLRRLGYRMGERYWDWRFGLRTYDYFPTGQLGSPDDGAAYEPVPFPLLLRLFRAIPAEFRGCGFLDYGCGLGRVLFVAHRRGYEPVLGVEISEFLCERARRNLANTSASIVRSHAADLAIPTAVRVFFLFNPFVGETLEAVILRIEAHAVAVGHCLVIAVNLRNLGPALERSSQIERLRYGPSADAYDWGLYRIRSGR